MNRQLFMPDSDIAVACGRVAVLCGGISAEREISLQSGRAVHTALMTAGVDAFQLDMGDQALRQLLTLKADRVFNVLHGRGGEDGHIQAVLEMMSMPYTGSGVCASALSMDKLATKRILNGVGIATPEYCVLNCESDCLRLLETIGLPIFVKPALEGSSIGMTLVHRDQDLIPAWHRARAYGAVLAEKLITGKEYTAGFLGDEVLPLIRLDTPREFYDYDAKYRADDTIYTCPCGLSDDVIAVINNLVQRTIHVLGVQYWGRVDLMLDESGQPWVIEVNTVPGMTDHSLVPLAARVAGLEMPDLVLKILQFTLLTGGQRV